MIKSRNLSSHTYYKKVADDIVNKITLASRVQFVSESSALLLHENKSRLFKRRNWGLFAKENKDNQMTEEKTLKATCECGKFCVEILTFPKNTPGRLKCYCDDCQSFLHYIQRADLLDENGGTEIIPFYPAELKIISGKELLKCLRLVSHGMFRFYTSCCNTPVANTDPKRAWAGFHRRMLVRKISSHIEQSLGPIRASILGKYAKGVPPAGTPQKINFTGIKVVLPFILKGILGKKSRPSPFFLDNSEEPVVPAYILSSEERKAALGLAGFTN